MKKTKLLIGTLALSMGLMGTGYAYWTKQLTVDTTVKSANFDVHYSAANAIQTSKAGSIDNTENKIASTMSDGKDKVTYEWSNIYPGSQATLSFTIQNDSTISVYAKPVMTITEKGSKGEVSAALQNALTFTYNGKEYKGFSAFQLAFDKEMRLKTTEAKKCDIIVTLGSDVTSLDTVNKGIVFNLNMVWGQFNDANPTLPQTSPVPPVPPVPGK